MSWDRRGQGKANHEDCLSCWMNEMKQIRIRQSYAKKRSLSALEYHARQIFEEAIWLGKLSIGHNPGQFHGEVGEEGQYYLEY